MIVFLARYPNYENIRDGMMQRIAAIDELVGAEKRIYLDISLKRNLSRKTIRHNNCIVEQLNLFVHFFIIMNYLNAADKIYAHSLFHLAKVHYFYNPNKTILDIHGVVPEELEFMGHHLIARFMRKVERKAILKCSKLIHVTHSMLAHYESIYDCNIESKSIILPIFESAKVENNLSKWEVSKYKIAYVGGNQAWQNIDLMVDSIIKINNTTNEFEFYLFFPANLVASFKEKYSALSSLENVFISSLPKDEVIPFLSTCHLGFVLRDSILVNHVACPTKLIEYLECGVVPIIKSPKIGDFEMLGYHYIDVNSLLNSTFNKHQLKGMCLHNFDTINVFKNKASLAKERLIQHLSNVINE